MQGNAGGKTGGFVWQWRGQAQGRANALGDGMDDGKAKAAALARLLAAHKTTGQGGKFGRGDGRAVILDAQRAARVKRDADRPLPMAQGKVRPSKCSVCAALSTRTAMFMLLCSHRAMRKTGSHFSAQCS